MIKSILLVAAAFLIGTTAVLMVLFLFGLFGFLIEGLGILWASIIMYVIVSVVGGIVVYYAYYAKE